MADEKKLTNGTPTKAAGRPTTTAPLQVHLRECVKEMLGLIGLPATAARLGLTRATVASAALGEPVRLATASHLHLMFSRIDGGELVPDDDDELEPSGTASSKEHAQP